MAIHCSALLPKTAESSLIIRAAQTEGQSTNYLTNMSKNGQGHEKHERLRNRHRPRRPRRHENEMQRGIQGGIWEQEGDFRGKTREI